MVNELTAQQTEVVSEALSRLEKLIHFADAEMKAATLEYINCQLLHSEPRSNGTFLSRSVNSLKGSIAAKILRDAIRPVLQLRESVPGDREKSLKTLRAVVASLQTIDQPKTDHLGAKKKAAKPQRLRGEAKQKRDKGIREFARQNDHTQAELAVIFGLSESTINEILNPKK